MLKKRVSRWQRSHLRRGWVRATFKEEFNYYPLQTTETGVKYTSMNTVYDTNSDLYCVFYRTH